MRLIVPILFLLVAACSRFYAATYYVSTNGNNAADGSLSTPWSNIWYAAKTVAAGDTVIINAGEYNEYVTNTVSGTVGNPITFAGERGPDGEWLTIIDPSVAFTNGWVLSPYGSGVYMQTNMPFETHELTIDHKRVAFAYTNGYLPAIKSSAYNDTTDLPSSSTNGSDLILLSYSSQVNQKIYSLTNIVWWDTVGAFWMSTSSVCYLRLRDQSDPNGLNIRCAQGYLNEWRYGKPAIKSYNKSYICWSNIAVRGSSMGISIDLCDNWQVVSNYISNGSQRVLVGTDCHDIQFIGNDLTCNYYGYSDSGAHNTSLTNSKWANRTHTYTIAKYLMGPDLSTLDDSFVLANSLSNITLAFNHTYQTGGEGINCEGRVAQACTNVLIYSNLVEHSSDVGILIAEGYTGVKVFDNQISDCNINFRAHHNNWANETNRIVYAYRNRFGLTNSVGDHIYYHYNSGSPASYIPTWWFYHNSFSGGKSDIRVSMDDAMTSGGITNSHFINNVFSGTEFIETESMAGAGQEFLTNAAMVGDFAYNMITPPFNTYPTTNDPAWYAASNIKAASPVWTTNSVPDFVLPSGSPAINAALDLTQPFTLQGIVYPALPTNSTVKVGPSWDMGALEAGYLGNIGTIRVGTLRGP